MIYGWIPEWPKGTDCKSAATRFGGSNPPPSMIYERHVFEQSDTWRFLHLAIDYFYD